VLADHAAQFFYVLDLETGKHIVVSKKNIGVDNIEDNDENINQYEEMSEMSLLTNPMNIKHIEKDFDKNLLLYMRKGGKQNLQDLAV
jgi:hypothetical protein